MAKKAKLSAREYAAALVRVSRTAFGIAPSAGIIQLVDSIVQAVLPLTITYFAALTTTALADAYAGDPSASKRVLVYIIATSVVGIIRLMWGSISDYMYQKTRYIINSAIEDRLMLQFSSLPFAMYDDKETVDLHDKARRFSTFFAYIFSNVGQMTTNIFGAIGAMIALTAVSWWLALAVFVAVVPGAVIQLKLARHQAQHWEGNITKRRRAAELNWILHGPRHVAEMRVYGIVKHLIAMHATLRHQTEKERLDLELNSIWKRLAADVVEAVVELSALVWVTLEIVNRNQPVGQFLYVQQMVSRALSQSSSFASELGRIDEDLANIVDYQRFMDLPIEEETGKHMREAPQNISLQDISFSYPKTSKLVLDGVSFQIHKGEHVAIVGENGAGKTTLVKLLMGLYTPTGGSISVDDRPLHEYRLTSWHKHIGLLEQDFVRYAFATIRENVIFGDITIKPGDEDRALRESMAAAEFQSVVDKLDRGVDTYVERWMAEDNDEITATELSGGQYQRLALARNFYRDAPIVILDEPTSAIDALAEARIFKRLFESDKTIITISHRLNTVKKADIVYMMKDGKIVERGSADELIAGRGEFFHMFESQIDA